MLVNPPPFLNTFFHLLSIYSFRECFTLIYFVPSEIDTKEQLIM